MPVFEVDSNEIAFVGSGVGVGLAIMSVGYCPGTGWLELRYS